MTTCPRRFALRAWAAPMPTSAASAGREQRHVVVVEDAACEGVHDVDDSCPARPHDQRTKPPVAGARANRGDEPGDRRDERHGEQPHDLVAHAGVEQAEDPRRAAELVDPTAATSAKTSRRAATTATGPGGRPGEAAEAVVSEHEVERAPVGAATDPRPVTQRPQVDQTHPHDRDT